MIVNSTGKRCRGRVASDKYEQVLQSNLRKGMQSHAVSHCQVFPTHYSWTTCKAQDVCVWGGGGHSCVSRLEASKKQKDGLKDTFQVMDTHNHIHWQQGSRQTTVFGAETHFHLFNVFLAESHIFLTLHRIRFCHEVLLLLLLTLTVLGSLMGGKKFI